MTNMKLDFILCAFFSPVLPKFSTRDGNKWPKVKDSQQIMPQSCGVTHKAPGPLPNTPAPQVLTRIWSPANFSTGQNPITQMRRHSLIGGEPH